MSTKNVLLLQVFFINDVELFPREVSSIQRFLGNGFTRAMHDKRHLAFVLPSQETPRQFIARLRCVLDVDCISNYWALIPSRNIASKYQGLDSLSDRVNMAYALALNDNQRPKPASTRMIPPPAKRRKWTMEKKK